eukprot:363474-Chlamydomonas_euryale.AAC.20
MSMASPTTPACYFGSRQTGLSVTVMAGTVPVAIAAAASYNLQQRTLGGVSFREARAELLAYQKAERRKEISRVGRVLAIGV